MNRKERRAIQFGHFSENRILHQENVQYEKQNGLRGMTLIGEIDNACVHDSDLMFPVGEVAAFLKSHRTIEEECLFWNEGMTH